MKCDLCDKEFTMNELITLYRSDNKPVHNKCFEKAIRTLVKRNLPEPKQMNIKFGEK